MSIWDLIPKPQPVTIEGVDEPLFVRKFMLEDLDRIRSVQEDESASVVDKLCREVELSLCNEDGSLVVTTDDERAALRRLPTAVVMAIVNAARDANGIGSEKNAVEAEEEAKKD